MADSTKHSGGEQPKATKSLPFGATSEQWEATRCMRSYLSRLRDMEQEHIKEHGCKYYCEKLDRNYQSQAWIMTQIKLACLPPQGYYEIQAQKQQVLSLLEQGTLKPDRYIFEALGLDVDTAVSDLLATDSKPIDGSSDAPRGRSGRV